MMIYWQQNAYAIVLQIVNVSTSHSGYDVPMNIT
jgi:hypothetical protein